MESVIEINKLTFGYNTQNILEDVSFRIRKGDYVGLVGYNGSGKTTLIRLMLGLIRSAPGQVKLFGETLAEFKTWWKIGYMPQNLALYNPLFPATVGEIISLGLLSRKNFPKYITGDDWKKTHQVMHQLQIDDLQNRQINSLSGGQQQRVFLAKALISKPELLILDEPGNALDAFSRNNFFRILEDLNHQQHTTIIMVTHDIGQIGNYANKLLYLEKSILFYGDFSDFCKSDSMTRKFGIDAQHIICHQHG